MCYFQAKAAKQPSVALLLSWKEHDSGGAVTDEEVSISLGLFLSDFMEHMSPVTQV